MLVMHGWSMTDDAMRSGTNMDSLAGAQQNAIVVYPDGIGVGALSCWSIPNMANLGQCSFDAGIDDVGFINALIDQMFSRYSIDPSRIYAVGYSNGGMMALSLACRLSDRIAAVGAVAGGR
jgi:polyhydroxybutyrate depolymerase